MSKANIKLSLGTKPNFLMITDNGKQQIITVDMLKNIWDNLSEDEISDIEYLNAKVYNEYVIGCVTVSQGQGGIVFIWDTQSEKFIHYSNGDYAVKAVIHNNMVFVLRQIAYWGVETHLKLDCCPLGTTSLDNQVTEIDLDENTAFSLSSNPDSYMIKIDEDIPIIGIRNEKQMLITDLH